MEECKVRQKRKFDTLLSSATGGNRQQCPSDRWVVNLSSMPLSMMEKEVLKKGLNFAPAPRHFPVPEIVAAVEVGLGKVSSTLAQQARTKIAGHLSKARPLPTNLHPKEQKAIKTLREADYIVIAPADKGNATVMMDRSDYDGKIRTPLCIFSREKLALSPARFPNQTKLPPFTLCETAVTGSHTVTLGSHLKWQPCNDCY